MTGTGDKDFGPLFARLRELMAPVGEQLVVVRDQPDDYYVETRWVRDDGYHGFFGAVQTRKRYVSYHLMPVYAWPDLLADVSPELRKRMQGSPASTSPPPTRRSWPSSASSPSGPSCGCGTPVPTSTPGTAGPTHRPALSSEDADGDLGRGAEQPLDLVVELDQGERGTGHVQRRAVLVDVAAPRP